MPYHWYREMVDQAVNQGVWRGGGKFELNKKSAPGSDGSPEGDFWEFCRKGEIAWICKDCLKNNGSMGKEKECTCEKEKV